MVKAYLRYEPAGAFGVIASAANVVYDNCGRFLITPALESALVWNVKQGVQTKSLAPATASSSAAPRAPPEVTQLARAPTGNLLAAGYSDGSIRFWDLASGDCTVTLQGHKSAVTALRFGRSGALLASGSNDTDVIVWDVVGEAGVVRLRGHKGAVTDAVVVESAGKLVSSGKDGAVRVWDLTTQHCCQVVGGAKGEVWSLDVDPSESRLVTAAADLELRVYALAKPQAGEGDDKDAASSGGGRGAHEFLRPMGSVRRQAQERAARVRYDPTGALLGVLAAGKSLELFSVRGAEEARKKMKRRKKRRAEKQAAKAAKSGAASAPGGKGGEDEEGDEDEGEAHDDGGEGGVEAVQAGDELAAMLMVVSKHKIKSFAFAPADARRKGCAAQVALGLADNSVEIVDVKADSSEVRSRLDQAGHRGDVRALALSSDDAALLTTSSAGSKVWNPASGACVGTLGGGYGLCCVFAPGNRHAVVGTKEGTLEVFDVGACELIHTEPAHSGPVWSLALLPDRSGFVSGSADKTVKFWTWAVAEGGGGGTGKKKGRKGADGGGGEEEGGEGSGGGRRLSVALTRSLEMAEDVLCVRVSPDGRLLAVALLDATIKVYYQDSLKFFLSLYGHKLPVLSMDISSDSTLLVSGSADKNIKVWGLDFGDCHRSVFAHQDAVTAVSFVRDTHYAFSAGKDRMVKYWDLDRFEMLLEMPGHQGEVWALAASAYGDFVVSGSHDRSIRKWERTNEPFFVEEEKEKRLESLFEADLEQQQAAAEREAAAGTAGDGDGGGAAPAGRRTIESVGAADSIVDALDVAANEERKAAEYRAAQDEAAAAAAARADADGLPAAGRRKRVAAARAAVKKPPSNPLMLGLAPGAYVLRCISGVRASDLEQALLLLPFADALRLMGYLSDWLGQGAHVELCCRAAALLLRLHHAQLVATPAARGALTALQARLRGAAQGLKDTLGFNVAALRHLRRAAGDAAGADGGAGVAAARRQLLGARAV